MPPAPPRPDSPIALPANQVQVWRASLRADVDELRHARDLLVPEEQERALRYRHGADAARFVMRRGLLRLLLSRYLGQPGRAIGLRTSEHGKPALLATATPSVLHFSLSHSRDAALYAFAMGRAVGVDIERVGADISGALGTVVGDDLLARTSALPADRRLELSYRYWVRAEACLKAAGTGLPGAASLLGDGGADGRMAGGLVRTATSDFRLWDLGRGHSHAAALAVEGRDVATVRIARLRAPT
jgi:4'-phosphopantetheinyl transferase